MLGKLARLVIGVGGGALLAALSVMGFASVQLNRPRHVTSEVVLVPPADSAVLARGRHLATAIMKCVECHDNDLGGRVPFVDAGPLGVVNATNLTRGKGGILDRYDDPALARAIRRGLKADGRPILIMPARDYQLVSNADLAAVIGYLRSRAPVDRVVPPSNVKPLGKLLNGLGVFPLYDADVVDPAALPSPDLLPTVSVEYGRYLATIGGCTGCHGPGLSGGKIPGAPPDWKPATNLTPAGLKGWTEADFQTALRTGIRPNKTPIDTLMPWRLAGQMDSTEMAAVWLFLTSVPPKPFGGR